MVRALIVSAVEDDCGARSAMTEALWPLIVAYVDAHLTEPDLSPARIARANNISLRYLYKLCARRGVRLGEWIMDRRLRGAARSCRGRVPGRWRRSRGGGGSLTLPISASGSVTPLGCRLGSARFWPKYIDRLRLTNKIAGITASGAGLAKKVCAARPMPL